MNDIAWIIHVIRHREDVDAATLPYIDEFDADPEAWRLKYRALYPKDEGSIDELAFDLG